MTKARRTRAGTGSREQGTGYRPSREKREPGTGNREPAEPIHSPGSRIPDPAVSGGSRIPDPESLGLQCPGCGCRHHYTLYTRAAPGGRVLRRRECRHCGRRMTTLEEERPES